MSQIVVNLAVAGAKAAVGALDGLYTQTLAEHGPDTPVGFPDTAYRLPLILGMSGQAVEKLEDLGTVLAAAKQLLPTGEPGLGEALDAGMATLYAAEAIQAIRFLKNDQPEVVTGVKGHEAGYKVIGPISDVQLRAWGIQLVDGRMAGAAAIIGCAKSNEVAVKIVREFQRRNILCLLCGNVNGRSIIHQLLEEGVELGYDTYTVPFGTDTVSAIYALGFAARAAMTFGGMKGGQKQQILEYNRARVPAFVLALGGVDELKVSAAAGALNFGFPIISDTPVPEILASPVTKYEALVGMPFDEIAGKDDMERAEKLVQKCVEVRDIKIRITDVPVPVSYGSAFEGEVVRKADMRVEFGGKKARCFEYLRMRDFDAVQDGQVTVVGPDLSNVPVGGAVDMGILVEVAGRTMQKDFEPVLERQIHHFINGASGVQHIGQRDITWLRVSKVAADKGFDLRHFGDVLHARFHSDFGAIVDKVQVTIFTDPAAVDTWLTTARSAYDERNVRLGNLVDESVDEFYSCTLCQSFAPNHVCVVTPERLGLCGAYNWLDCKASFQINPTGPNQPIQKSTTLDESKGYWTGTNTFIDSASHQQVKEVAIYSIMENPMTACGCFECIAMVIPEANGVMIVSREDTSVTPTGMTFSTLAGMAGGGQQTPGIMGHGKFYILSPKFISADGGFKRIVWMSSILKEQMADQLKAVATREGDPHLMDKVCDERIATDVDGLVAFLTEQSHPALAMDPLM